MTKICKKLPFECGSKDLLQSSDIMTSIKDRKSQLLHLYLQDRRPFSISEFVLVINHYLLQGVECRDAVFAVCLFSVTDKG